MSVKKIFFFLAIALLVSFVFLGPFGTLLLAGILTGPVGVTLAITGGIAYYATKIKLKKNDDRSGVTLAKNSALVMVKILLFIPAVITILLTVVAAGYVVAVRLEIYIAKTDTSLRAKALQELTDSQNAIKAANPSFTYYAKASHDECITGQHNWEVRDDYRLKCIYKLTYIYGVKADVNPGYLADLEQKLQQQGWHINTQSYMQPISGIRTSAMPGYVNSASSEFRSYQYKDTTQYLSGIIVDNTLRPMDIELLEFDTINIDGDLFPKFETIKKPTGDFNALYHTITTENPYLLSVSIEDTYVNKKYYDIPVVGFFTDLFLGPFS